MIEFLVGVCFGIFCAWVWNLLYIEDTDSAHPQLDCSAVNDHPIALIDSDCEDEEDAQIDIDAFYDKHYGPIHDTSTHAGSMAALWDFIKCTDDYTQEFIYAQMDEDLRENIWE
ncbi:unnamed protein product [Caenorhabditis angaria]|uniref:Uncharacterized protein n=1 Tax=Caenorhabditis angaria TaxID=860376 RepID=A0A9P1IZ20_9PELO|nr:unnamed protein product [Caenorhabditis angaria]